MTESAAKPPAAAALPEEVEPLVLSLLRPQPVSARPATAVTARTLVKVRMCPSFCVRYAPKDAGGFSFAVGAARSLVGAPVSSRC